MKKIIIICGVISITLYIIVYLNWYIDANGHNVIISMSNNVFEDTIKQKMVIDDNLIFEDVLLPGTLYREKLLNLSLGSHDVVCYHNILKEPLRFRIFVFPMKWVDLDYTDKDYHGAPEKIVILIKSSSPILHY